MLYIFYALVVIAVILFLYRFAILVERASDYKNLHRVIDEINKAKNIRQQLFDYADYASRVREKFTRK